MRINFFSACVVSARFKQTYGFSAGMAGMAILLLVLYSKERKFKLFQIIATYRIIKKKDMCRNTIQEKINININGKQ
jgi:hypothetical protein